MNEDQKEVAPPDFSGEEMKMPENTDAQPEVKETSSIIGGPLLVILALLLVVILGGMYYWFNTMNVPAPVSPVIERPTIEENNEPESTTAEAQVETMQAVSTSDEIDAIEADLEATDLDSIDTELNAIDAELEAALQ